MKHLQFLIIALFIKLSVNAQLPVSHSLSNKNVVLEEFTGIHCVNCPDGHKIAQQIKDSHPNDVFLINIHTGEYSEPYPNEPDFRTNFGSLLASQSGLQGYPSGTINRHVFSGSNTVLNRAHWGVKSNTILNQQSYVNVALEASLNILTRELSVNVEVFYTGNGAPINNLNIAILQDHIEGVQKGGAYINPAQVLPNGLYDHMHMLRHLITGQWGDVISTTTQGTLVQRNYTYTIPNDLNGVDFDLENISVVAFISEGHQEIITGAEAELHYTTPNNYTQVDLSSVSNMQLPAVYCDNNVTPEITVKNEGANDIMNYGINYSLNGGSLVSQTINMNLASGASATFLFPSINLPNGENIFVFNVSPLPNSSSLEVITSNNEFSLTPIYVTSPSSFASTYTEGFESYELEDKFFTHAISDNPDNLPVYVVSAAVSSSVNQGLGAFGLSGKSFRWDFYSMPTGENSKLIFENLDFSNDTANSLIFSNAYSYSDNRNDKLEVLVSTDCGASWNIEFSKQGQELSTASASLSCFYPIFNEWKTNTIDLTSYSGEEKVMIAFKGTSDNGNDLYIDDIQIVNNFTTEITNNEGDFDISLYPNPINGRVASFNVISPISTNAQINIYNNIGKLVVSKNNIGIIKGKNKIELDLEVLANGLYFSNILIDEQMVVHKFYLLK